MLFIITILLIFLFAFMCLSIYKSNYIDPESIGWNKYKLSTEDQYLLQDVQKELSKLLKDVTKLAKDNNIKMIADAGTLIGAMRHNGWIPWDDDMDFLVDMNDIKRFKNILINNNFHIESNHFYKNKGIKILTESGGFIDIFPIELKIKINGRQTKLNYSDLYPLNQSMFENTVVSTPRNIDEYLKTQLFYKKYKTIDSIPSYKYRNPKHMSEIKKWNKFLRKKNKHR